MTASVLYGHSQRVNSLVAYSINPFDYGAAVGDSIILTVMRDNSTATAPNQTGWTKLVDNVATGTRTNELLARTLTTEGETFSWAATSGNRTYQLLIVKNAGPIASWVLGSLGTRAASGGTFSTTAPSVTTTEDNELIVLIATEATAANETTTPTISPAGTMALVDWSTTDTATNITETVITFKSVKATAGASSAYTITWPNTQTVNSLALQIAIPAAPVSEDHSGALLVGWKRGAGDIVQGRLVAKLAGPVFKDVKGFVRVPAGFPTVDAMLRQPLFEVAHRGGSVSFPEMSLHAYTQSVILGYKALEISLNRTSDGVWVGVHDSTLDRTSAPETGLTVSSLTWAQVQTHQITIGPQAPKPYMRLEQLLDAYGRTHVLFMDPKGALSFRTELLNKLQAYYGSDAEAAKHVVAKYYGVEGNAAGTTGWARDAGLRGYKRWGYFYQVETENGQLATYQGRWDILGMDYGASAAAWAAVKSYGKPVIAHILPSVAARTTAMAYSPNGLMVSGTALITPSAF